MRVRRPIAFLVLVVAASCGHDVEYERARVRVLVDERRYREASALVPRLGDTATLDPQTHAAAVIALLGSAGLCPENLLDPPPWFAPATPGISTAAFGMLVDLRPGEREAFRRAREIARQSPLESSWFLALAQARLGGAMVRAIEDRRSAKTSGTRESGEASRELLDELRAISTVEVAELPFQTAASGNLHAVAAAMLRELDSRADSRGDAVSESIDRAIRDASERR